MSRAPEGMQTRKVGRGRVDGVPAPLARDPRPIADPDWIPLSDGELAVLIPVLNRPDALADCLESLRGATPAPWRAVILWTAGYQQEADAVAQAAAEDERVVSVKVDRWDGPGDWARKINLGVQLTSEPWIFFGADDLRFHPGWFEAAVDLAEQRSAEAGYPVGAVGTNDLGPWRPNSPARDDVREGLSATHVLVARWYTRFGSIDDSSLVLHEGYPHEFVDDEFAATARRRSTWAFAEASHVEHLHPNLGHPDYEGSYTGAGPRRLAESREVYRARAHLWGETPPRR